MIIDLHTHTTPYSDDSDLSPTELIQQAKRSGLDGICLTEHDFFWKEEDVAQLSLQHDFPVFPGVEINTEEGHLLVFGLKKYEFGMYHVEYLKQMVNEVGGVIIFAHPYRGRVHHNPSTDLLLDRACKNPILNSVVAVEMLNGRSKSAENSFAHELCHRMNLKSVGGSDAHSPSDIPTCATVFESGISNLKELITELKAGRFMAIDLRTAKLGSR